MSIKNGSCVVRTLLFFYLLFTLAATAVFSYSFSESRIPMSTSSSCEQFLGNPVHSYLTFVTVKKESKKHFSYKSFILKSKESNNAV